VSTSAVDLGSLLAEGERLEAQLQERLNLLKSERSAGGAWAQVLEHHPSLAGLPPVVVERKYAAADEHYRHLDSVDSWLTDQLARLQEAGQQTDVAALVRSAMAAVEKAYRPSPSRKTIEEDLRAAQESLGSVYTEAREVWARISAGAWDDLVAALHGTDERAIMDALLFWLASIFNYSRVQKEPAAELVRRLEALIRETSPPLASLLGDESASPAESETSVTGHAEPSPPELQFRQIGKVWQLRFQGEHTICKPSKGLSHLARLLGRPKSFIEALKLQDPEWQATNVDHLSGDEVADEKAIGEYHAHYNKLEDEIEKAKLAGDNLLLDELQKEKEDLQKEIFGLYAPGGRIRRVGPLSPAERAADAVRKAIERCLREIKKEMPLLHKHLDENIKREGTTFAYYPPNSFPTWDVE
jgi:hypothetical protein